MPVDEITAPELENPTPDEPGKETFDLDFIDGEFCPVDATDDRIAIEDLEEDQKSCLSGLSKKAAERDLTSYRIEVRDCWKQRYFWRGNQYLLPAKNGMWVTPKMVLMAGQSYEDHAQETNVYLAFGDTIVAALTGSLPSTRFEAGDPANPRDITAAEKSDGARKLFERQNKMPEVQADFVRYLWTDGRALYYTHHVLDAQRFGWTDDDDDEELSSFMSESDEPNDTREPRSEQVVESFGAMETKLPIQANNIDECDYLKLMREFDVSRLKTKYPEFADKIKPSVTPTASSDYVRLARVSVNMGMRPSNMTQDTQTYNATEDMTWVRPSFFMNEENAELRKWLFETFPSGALIVMVGNELVEARDEGMSEHWSLAHARPGDGMHRPSLGYPLVAPQEKLNDCMDLVHESFMHLIPRIWVDPRIDVDGVERTQRRPGQYMKAPKAVEGKAIAEAFFAEPQLQLAEGLLVYIEKLIGEFSQFLCGAFPALFGGDTKSNDTASGIATQRDQALGRIGGTWRGIKSAYAAMMKQAIEGIAKYHKGNLSGQIKAAGGRAEYLEISVDDLKGAIKCFPDQDDNFPESWVSQRNVWQQLLTAAATNPIIQRIVNTPKNILIMKDKIGTPDLVVPEAVAEVKQLQEIKELLDSDPLPNPMYEQAIEKLQELVNGGVDPQIIELAKQKISQVPPYVSSVPIDKLLDQHAFEAAAISTFGNEPEGIKARKEKPKGWINLQLHYMEHITAALANAQAQAANKPPSESINYKDLETADAKVQMLKQAGIKIDAASLQKELAAQNTPVPAGAGAGAAGSGAGSAGSGAGNQTGA